MTTPDAATWCAYDQMAVSDCGHAGLHERVAELETAATLHAQAVAALEREVERLKREVAEGFKVEVVDVTGDSAMMAENGRLKERVRELEQGPAREGPET